MIRINLLPYKEATLVQWGQRQLLIYIAALLVAVLVCVIWYGRRPDPQARLRQLRAQRASLEREIRTEQSRSFCNRTQYRRRIKKAQDKTKAVERLITRRRNPKYVLRELSRILSEAWGPTEKLALQGKDKQSLYNQNWDPSGVWITRFEEQNRLVQIEGGAKASDDVAEFWRRLQVSAYFYDVELEKFSKVDKGDDAKDRYLKFSIVAGVNY
jgi:Tfp pilus assembly protein PilN